MEEKPSYADLAKRNRELEATVARCEQKEQTLSCMSGAVERASEAIGMIDTQGKPLYQNKAFSDLFEYAPDEFEAVGGTTAIHADPAVADEVLAQVLSGRTWSGQTEMISKSGRRFPILLRAEGICDDGGDITGLVGYYTDVTAEWKYADEALRESRDELMQSLAARTAELAAANKKLQQEVADREEAQAQLACFHRFVEASGEGMGWADVDSKVRYLNPALCRMLDEKHAENGYGKPVLRYYSAETQRRLEEEIFPAVLRDGIWTGELTLHSVAGKRVPTANSLFVLRDAEGNPSSFGNVVTDLTDRKRTEDELRRHRDNLEELVAQRTVDLMRSNEELHREIVERRQAEAALQKVSEELERRVHDRTAALEAANRELESFSYSVSHDLRAPLRAINGFSQALQEDYGEQLDEQGRRYLGRIGRATLRMGELIDDLLQLSRVTRHELAVSEIDMTRIVRGIERELRQAEPDRQLEFIVADGVRASGDGHLVKTVLQNLLENAVKYTSRVAKARIEFGVSEMGETRAFFVRDNGAGFDMTYREKLFAAFQRLHSDQEFAGTGIGLSIVHRIVSKHKGRVWAEGEVGKGAVFYFTLGELGEPMAAGDGRTGEARSPKPTD
jgi:PAS domain S-box-containing protein